MWRYNKNMFVWVVAFLERNVWYPHIIQLEIRYFSFTLDTATKTNILFIVRLEIAVFFV